MGTYPQILTIPNILKAIRKYSKAGMLGAQKHDTCRYSYSDGCRCAIGVALNDETIKAINEGLHNLKDVGHLVDMGIVAFNSPGDREKAVEIQTKHDRWANNKDSCMMIERKREFYKQLKELEGQYR